MNISTVIFDMDGVLSDTQELHALAESALLAKYGIQLSPNEITRRFAGYSDHEFYATVFQEAGMESVDVSAVAQEKWGPFLKQAPGHIVAIPGAVETVQRLHQAGYLLGVASASVPAFIKIVVEELGIAPYFHTLTSGKEVQHGKPAPDIFLLAAQRLGRQPNECLVIEDGVNGMIAAQRAGMKCIGLVQAHLASLHPDYPATIVVPSHDHITPQLLNELGQS